MIQRLQTTSPKDTSAFKKYEDLLNADNEFAMNEGDAFFADQGKVHESKRRIAKRLDELGVKFVIVGGLALFGHGFRRYTEDVDLLVTPESLKQIHEQLEGLGYVPPFAGSKQLRDVQSGVKIEFLVSGQFPGDGKPKPVSFPDPSDVVVEIKGLPYISLPKLVELKLASGMTGALRAKDLGDVQELIKAFDLSEEFGAQLDPFVRDKFVEYVRLHKSQPDPQE